MVVPRLFRVGGGKGPIVVSFKAANPSLVKSLFKPVAAKEDLWMFSRNFAK
jgi:hypothetical protein